MFSSFQSSVNNFTEVISTRIKIHVLFVEAWLHLNYKQEPLLLQIMLATNNSIT